MNDRIREGVSSLIALLGLFVILTAGQQDRFWIYAGVALLLVALTLYLTFRINSAQIVEGVVTDIESFGSKLQDGSTIPHLKVYIDRKMYDFDTELHHQITQVRVGQRVKIVFDEDRIISLKIQA